MCRENFRDGDFPKPPLVHEGDKELTRRPKGGWGCMPGVGWTVLKETPSPVLPCHYRNESVSEARDDGEAGAAATVVTQPGGVPAGG